MNKKVILFIILSFNFACWYYFSSSNKNENNDKVSNQEEMSKFFKPKINKEKDNSKPSITESLQNNGKDNIKEKFELKSEVTNTENNMALKAPPQNLPQDIRDDLLDPNRRKDIYKKFLNDEKLLNTIETLEKLDRNVASEVKENLDEKKLIDDVNKESYLKEQIESDKDLELIDM